MIARHTIEMLHGLAEKDVEAAAEALLQANQQADQAKQKHDMLLNYRADYLAHFNAQLEQGLSADRYQNFQDFFRKLDTAIAGQDELVRQSEYLVSVEKAKWMAQQRKKMSYGVLEKRSLTEQTHKQAKLDQKQMDAFAARARKK